MKKTLSKIVLSLFATLSLVLLPTASVSYALPAPTNFTFNSLEDSLAAYWPFDDNMVDYSINSNFANTTTAYYSDTGVGGRSLYFNRALPSTVSIPDDPTINNFDQEMAISSWFRLPNGELTDYAIIAQRDGWGDNFQVYANYSNFLRLSLWDRSDVETTYDVDVPVVADQWHHVLVNVKAAEYVRIYFDGGLVLEDTVNVPAQLSNDGVFTTLGDDFYGSGYMDGYIDEVALWKRVLTDAEIAFLYNGGYGESIPVVRDYLNWNFEDTYKKSKIDPAINEIQEYYPDNGHGSINLSGAQDFYLWGVGAGGSGTNAPIVNKWTNGEGIFYWRVATNSQGLTDLKVSSKQRSSNTGPRDFQLQYSISGRMPLVWQDVPGGLVTVGDNFTSGVLTDVPLPAECNDSNVLYLRWLMVSNFSVNGATVADAGTSRIDDIVLSGTKIIYEPVVNSVSPSNVLVGSGDTTIEVTGGQFTPSSEIVFESRTFPTTYVSSTKLTMVLPAGYMSAVGTYSFQVITPAPGGGTSNSVPFIVENLTPVLTSISPTSAPLGALGFTLTVSGSDFSSTDSVVRFNGSDKTTRFIDVNTLEADIPASDLLSVGSYNVTVFTALPGGGESAAQVFDVVNPVPAVTSISPSTATQNGATFNLTVYGSGFVNTSVVRFNGVDKASTYVDSSTLTAVIPAADLAVVGNFPIEVFSGLPGGGLSNAETFSVLAPAPAPAPGGSSGGGGAILPSALVFDITGATIVIDDPMNLMSENVDIRFDGFKDVKSYLVSENANFKGATWLPYSESVVFRTSSELGDKTLYFRFKSNSGLNSAVLSKDVSLQKNGSVVLHGSADGEVAPSQDFSKLSMNERVKYNLEKLRAKKKAWEDTNRSFQDIVIPYEMDLSSVPLNGESTVFHFAPENHSFSFDRDLSLGMRGEDVKNLQIILGKLGYYYYEDGATGYFGEVTKRALIDFQKDNGLDPFSGTLGLKTGNFINNEYLYLLY